MWMLRGWREGKQATRAVCKAVSSCGEVRPTSSTFWSWYLHFKFLQELKAVKVEGNIDTTYGVEDILPKFNCRSLRTWVIGGGRDKAITGQGDRQSVGSLVGGLSEAWYAMRWRFIDSSLNCTTWRMDVVISVGYRFARTSYRYQWFFRPKFLSAVKALYKINSISSQILNST